MPSPEDDVSVPLLLEQQELLSLMLQDVQYLAGFQQGLLMRDVSSEADIAQVFESRQREIRDARKRLRESHA